MYSYDQLAASTFWTVFLIIIFLIYKTFYKGQDCPIENI